MKHGMVNESVVGGVLDPVRKTIRDLGVNKAPKKGWILDAWSTVYDVGMEDLFHAKVRRDKPLMVYRGAFFRFLERHDDIVHWNRAFPRPALGDVLNRCHFVAVPLE